MKSRRTDRLLVDEWSGTSRSSARQPLDCRTRQSNTDPLSNGRKSKDPSPPKEALDAHALIWDPFRQPRAVTLSVIIISWTCHHPRYSMEKPKRPTVKRRLFISYCRFRDENGNYLSPISTLQFSKATARNWTDQKLKERMGTSDAPATIPCFVSTNSAISSRLCSAKGMYIAPKAGGLRLSRSWRDTETGICPVSSVATLPLLIRRSMASWKGRVLSPSRIHRDQSPMAFEKHRPALQPPGNGGAMDRRNRL